MSTVQPSDIIPHTIRIGLARKLRLYALSIGIFLAIYFTVTIVMPLVGRWIITMNADTEWGVLSSDVALPSAIFMGITSSVGAGSDFKLFLQNGFTRNHIFGITLGANAIASFVLAVIMTVIGWLFNTWGTGNVTFQFLPVSFYANETWGWEPVSNYAIVGILLFALIFLASAVGSWFGVFLDRAGVKTRLIVGGGFLLLPFVAGLIIDLFETITPGYDPFSLFARKALGLGNPTPQPWPFLATLVVGGVIFYGVMYLLNRRREVKHLSAS